MISGDAEDRTGVHSRLAAIRQKRCIPAAEMARRAGVSLLTIYAMEAAT
jgi:DNA-binding XRE family transcriptional regulator